eukprot:1373560-Rhodomonas_salina.3
MYVPHTRPTVGIALTGGRCSSLGLECQAWLQIASARVKRVERPHDDTSEVVASGVTVAVSDNSQGRRDKRPRQEHTALVTWQVWIVPPA